MLSLGLRASGADVDAIVAREGVGGDLSTGGCEQSDVWVVWVLEEPGVDAMLGCMDDLGVWLDAMVKGLGVRTEHVRHETREVSRASADIQERDAMFSFRKIQRL